MFNKLCIFLLFFNYVAKKLNKADFVFLLMYIISIVDLRWCVFSVDGFLTEYEKERERESERVCV